jgi:adenosylmethionine---8-amino-7-oxononanoate aminotransferase
MVMANQPWIERDLHHLWHPCTQMKDHETLPLIPIRRGYGVWLEDYEGKRYLDAISSWWVNLFGHANPRIAAAIGQQATTLEQVILAGFSHAPVIELSERLVALAPVGLTRCFYADNGSSAVEIALKMSYHYWLNRGQPQRRRFIALENSYHGETLGALAVGDVALYRQIYGPLLLEVLKTPSPDCWQREEGESCAEVAERQAERLAALLERHHHEICALVIEPLVQCAGGMRIYHPHYLRRARELCDHYKIHLIADEIAVGFGRTGTLFACEQGPITPDLLCLGKGLTGGFLPLAVVMTSEDIYSAFYADYHEMRAFLHSHSYTGNPLACAAALATLNIFTNDGVIANNQRLAAVMAAATAPLKDHPHVGDVRQQGMILAVEMVADRLRRTPYAWQERRGLRLYRHALGRGALLRPLGNVSYLMPPYVITPDEIEWLAGVMTEGVSIATAD